MKNKIKLKQNQTKQGCPQFNFIGARFVIEYSLFRKVQSWHTKFEKDKKA